MSCSRVIVTTTVAPTPPCFGSQVAGMASRRLVNANPLRTSLGRSGSIALSSGRAGLVKACSALVRIWPCRCGTRNWPWQMPSWSSHIEKDTLRSALASWASSTRPSRFSARSGAITSNRCRPRILSLSASKCAACSTRCCSACCFCSSGHGELALVGEPVQGGDDHPGLGGVHLAGLQRTCQYLVGLEPLGELEVRACCAAGLPGLDRQPVRRRTGTLLGGGTGAVCLGQHLQLQRSDLALQDAQVDQRLALFSRCHRPHRRGELACPGPGSGGEVAHRMHPGQGVGRLAGHDPIPAPTTDSSGL